MAKTGGLGFLSGGGEMGARMRALDWAQTPVGPPETWPQSLRSPLSMLLPSKAQIILFWGPHDIMERQLNHLVRRHPERRTALVALTGWGQDKDRERAREAGFDRHLVKPAEIEALQTLLSSL